MSVHKTCLAILVVLLGFTALPAYAKAPAKSDGMQKVLGTFGKWHAYTFDEHDQPVCYMAMSFVPPSTKKLKRGPGHLSITHRPSEGSKDVVSFTPGYAFKTDSVVKVKVGAKDFELFTTKDSAWARDTSIDHALAAAIRGNKGMGLTGEPSQHGAKAVTDKLDITGAAEAYRAIGKACGLEVDEPKPTKPKKAAPKAKAAPARTIKSNINKG